MHVVPKAAAQVGFQKRLLNFLPDLSHLESLSGSSHIPSGRKKVNSLLGCLPDRGMDALGGPGEDCFSSCFALLVAQHLPATCHSKPMCVTTDAGGTDILLQGLPPGLQTDHPLMEGSNPVWIVHISSSKGIPVPEAMEKPSVAQGELAVMNNFCHRYLFSAVLTLTLLRHNTRNLSPERSNVLILVGD